MVQRMASRTTACTPGVQALWPRPSTWFASTADIGSASRDSASTPWRIAPGSGPALAHGLRH
eukprot:11087452-Alexandrium_andersonii.AAC.1